FQTATSAQLRDILAQESGISLDDLFDAWVYGPGFPHFRIDSFRILPLSMPPPATVEVFMSQQGKGTLSTCGSLRTQVLFMNDQWQQHTCTIDLTTSSGSVVVEVPFWPQYAFIDPEEMLCDATTDAFLNIKSTGRKSFPDTWCEVDITGISDSLLLRATHHWVPPDHPAQPMPGFRLSDYRYWTIDRAGASPVSGKLRFFFTRFSYLDNGIILHPADSVVLMYRKGPGHDWISADAVMEGQTYQGYMVTDSLRAGDYAIGVWDHTYLGTAKHDHEEALLKVWPNPSSDTFVILSQHTAAYRFRVFSMDGHEVASGACGSAASVSWDARKESPGTYFILIEDQAGRSLGSCQAVKQ
ncbi:MAG TPA: hypothetical protein P5248_11940, partial [Bacteroidales bacterium]|nr:hypothetical protein [Bacteroidales bacterium]